jgi:outer membrane protein assembly factor BamB
MQIEAYTPAADTSAESVPALVPKPIRRWYAFLPAVAYWVILFLGKTLELPTFVRFASALLAGAMLVLFTLVWWWINRRTSLADRAIGFAIVVASGAVVIPLCDASTGVRGPGILMGPLPMVATLWTLAALLTRSAARGVQWVGLAAAMVLAWGWMPLVRINGLVGNTMPEYHWRWTPTPEEEFLAQHKDVSLAATSIRHVVSGPHDWPGFRGPNRDGVVRGVDIDTTSSPTEVWRRRVGPGWSSVIVVGDSLFTQEQRGAHEAVVCYATLTGDETWCHADDIRFSEETAGTGPRATPCFDKGKIFAVGCTGVLNCLDADTGERVWTHDLAAEFGAELPHWGFTSSPLVVGDLVVVFAGGRSTRNLLAYRTGTGELAWAAAAGETSYASPQVAKIDDQAEVLMMTNHGLTGVEPTTGKVLWDVDLHVPPSAPRSISPLPVSTTAILVGSEGDFGVKLIDVKRVGKTSEASARWTSKALKPAFNDPVVADGNIYGFDGRIFACVDLETGTRRWKEGRYGEGQVVLLADQSVLLVVSESGEVILLSANPGRHEKLGHFQALHGKSWSHPALVGRKLYLRNAEEMVCYEFRSPVPVK